MDVYNIFMKKYMPHKMDRKPVAGKVTFTQAVKQNEIALDEYEAFLIHPNTFEGNDRYQTKKVAMVMIALLVDNPNGANIDDISIFKNITVKNIEKRHPTGLYKLVLRGRGGIYIRKVKLCK